MNALQRALLGVLMLLAIVPASAKDVPVEFVSGRSAIFIKDDPGGVLTEFAKKYSTWRDDGTNVVIDGECVSACTMLLGLLRPEKVCATKDAVLGFHSASTETKEQGKPDIFKHAEEISALEFNMYPGVVRAFLAKEGWYGPNAHPEIIWVRGKDVNKFVRPCTADDLS
ncbi:hypothetical protein [Bradyrhizobium sp. SZCCHNR3118]|uniref:hypothetical protein n=1 Tax=Bradyrhizobium sp. SZCCHNR3118 TaxID=3057468 RepID=UPI0029162886|nr:hypothetical protein [Bradyrhizobium sp. SZCCHNR3118]